MEAEALSQADFIEAVEARLGPKCILTDPADIEPWLSDWRGRWHGRSASILQPRSTDEVAAMVLTTHILPDIMGNMRSYSSQTLRCTTCGAKFRRMPLIGKCSECGSELIQTVTRGAVEKYLGIATGMCAEYKINEYLKSRVDSLSMELKLIFKEQKKTQSSMMEFMDN